MKIKYGLWITFFFYLAVLVSLEAQSTTAAQSWRKMSDEFRKELTALQITLEQALKEAETSKNDLSLLTNSYKTLLRKTSGLEISLTITETKLKQAESLNARLTIILIAIAAALVLTRVAGAILWAKGIKLPYIINLIL